jgi:hypothetical protein
MFHRRYTFLVFPTFVSPFTSGPIGRRGRPVGRLGSRPFADPYASVPVGLLSAGCCPAPRAADLAGLRCRVGWPAAGPTATAAAVPASAPAAALSAQAWPLDGWWA